MNVIANQYVSIDFLCTVHNIPAIGYHQAVKKRVLAVVIIILAVLLGALVFFLTRPRVAIYEPGYPSGYEIISPSSFSLSYRVVSDPASADLALALPGAILPEGIEGITIGGDGADLSIDESAMWMTAMGDGVECLLYESSDQYASKIAEDLLENDGNAYAVTYDERVSVENMQRLLSSVSGSDKLLLLTPSSSIRLVRENQVVADTVMDYRDAAAIETTDIDEAVSIDWDSTIRSMLSGNPELSYALVSL